MRIILYYRNIEYVYMFTPRGILWRCNNIAHLHIFFIIYALPQPLTFFILQNIGKYILTLSFFLLNLYWKFLKSKSRFLIPILPHILQFVQFLICNCHYFLNVFYVQYSSSFNIVCSVLFCIHFFRSSTTTNTLVTVYLYSTVQSGKKGSMYKIKQDLNKPDM